jgi:hypothetical protein
MRVEVFTAWNMKIMVFWDIAPYSLVELQIRSRGAYCLHLQGALSQKAVIFTHKYIDSLSYIFYCTAYTVLHAEDIKITSQVAVVLQIFDRECQASSLDLLRSWL